MHILINETKCPLPSKVFNPHIAYIEIIGIFTKQTIWLICSYLVDQLYFYTVSRYLYAHDTIPLSHETVIHLYNTLRSNFCTIAIHFLFIGSLLLITNSLTLEKPTDGSFCSYDKHRIAKTTWHYVVCLSNWECILNVYIYIDMAIQHIRRSKKFRAFSCIFFFPAPIYNVC